MIGALEKPWDRRLPRIGALSNLRAAGCLDPTVRVSLERSPMAINKAVLAAMRAAGKVAPDIRQSYKAIRVA